MQRKFNPERGCLGLEFYGWVNLGSQRLVIFDNFDSSSLGRYSNLIHDFEIIHNYGRS